MIIRWVPRIYGYSAEFRWGESVVVLKLEHKKDGELEAMGHEPGNWQGSLTFDGDTESAFIWSTEIYNDERAVRYQALSQLQWALRGLTDQVDLELPNHPVPVEIS